MNYTQNYQLPQWVESDRVLMDDFNDMTGKLETALSGKADSADLTSLNQTVSALSGAVDDHTDALEEKGNCRVMRAYYVGTGTSGQDHKHFFNFPPDRPVMVLIINDSNNSFLRMVRASTHARASNNYDSVTVTWEDSSISWYADAANAMMNEAGAKYHILVLMDCEGE